MSLLDLHSLPITQAAPDATDSYPGHLYFHAEKNIYFTAFENIYGDFEVNNWLPRKINDGVYKLVKKDDERFYGLNQANSDRIPLKYMGDIPILCDDWVLVSADKVVLEEDFEEPQPQVEDDLLLEPQTVLESALEDADFLYSTLTNMLQPSLPSPAPVTVLPLVTLPPSTGAVEVLRALLNWESPSMASWIDTSHEVLVPPKIITPPQKRIADVMIADAVSKGYTCPISMNPLTLVSAVCVSPCYHIFEKEAIQTWLQEKSTCPECREVCSL